MIKPFTGWKLYANSDDFFDGTYIDANGHSMKDLDEPLQSFDGMDDIPDVVLKLIREYDVPRYGITPFGIVSKNGIVYITMEFIFDPEYFDNETIAKKYADKVMQELSEETGFDVIDSGDTDPDYDLMIPASEAENFEQKYHCLKHSSDESFAKKYYHAYVEASNNVSVEKEMSDEYRQCLYQLYQLDWIMSHNHSVKDIVTSCEELAANEVVDYANSLPDSKGDLPIVNLDFESRGFENGDLYVCFDEFIKVEYQDPAYIHELINKSGVTFDKRDALWKSYLSDIGADSEKYSDIERHYYVLCSTTCHDEDARIAAGPFVSFDTAYQAMRKTTINDLEYIKEMSYDKAVETWEHTINSSSRTTKDLLIGNDVVQVFSGEYMDEFQIVEY